VRFMRSLGGVSAHIYDLWPSRLGARDGLHDMLDEEVLYT
jgi:hypothetical protein